MAEVFSSAFVAEQHTQWPGSFSWDPSQLQALPSPESASSNGQVIDPSTEAGYRDQSLGPLPVGWEEEAAPSEAAGAGAAKEAKFAHGRNTKGPLICQVEGCGYDLSAEKGYYQRYRVCEPHVKLLSLVVNGKPSRFCQQCGRFHELSKFDGNKRSCRARLLQHNARRRKRDPYDTSRREAGYGRKGRNPWSGSSDETEPASNGSADISHGPDKTPAYHNLDGGVDQGDSGHSFTPDMPFTSGAGAVAAWAGPGAAGFGPLDVPAMEAPGYPAPAPTLPQQLPGQLLPGHAIMGQPLPGQPLLAQPKLEPVHSSRVGYVRWQPGGQVPDKLDDIIDSIIGNDMDYLMDPLMGLPPRAAPNGPGVAATPVLAGGGGLAGLTARPSPSPADPMWVGSATNSPALSGAALNPNKSLSYGLPSIASGPWVPGCMSLSGAAAGPRTLQQRQTEWSQPGSSAAASLMGTFNSSSYSGFLGNGLGSGPGNGPFGGGAAGPCSDQGFGPRPSVGVWASARSSGALEPLSGGGGAFAGGRDSSMGGTHPLSAAAAAGLSGVTSGSGGSFPGAAGAAAPPPPRPSAQSSFDLARRLVAGGGAAAQYKSEDLMVRVSIKIANCTPNQLPPDLYQRLRNLLNTADASLVQGFLRPGCTHLVLDLAQARCAGEGEGVGPDCDGGVDGPGSGAGAAAPAAVAAAPLSGGAIRACLGSAASRGSVLVQTEEVSLWPAGARAAAAPQHCARVSDLKASRSLPAIAHVSPAVHVGDTSRAELLVFGVGLAAAGVKLFARMQGGYLPVSVQPLIVGCEVAPAAAAEEGLAQAAAAALRSSAALRSTGRDAEDAVLVTVERAPGTGLLLLEAQAGALLSNWRPCLLSRDAGIAAELAAWAAAALHAGPAALASLEAFVVDLGRVLDRRSYARPAPPRSSRWGSRRSCEAISEGAGEEFGEECPSAGVASSGSVGEEDGEGVTMELVCACERLLGWSADAGLPRVSVFLAAALLQYGQGAQAILEAPYADGLSVLHRCIRSGSAAAVAALADWAASCGVKLGWGCAGTLGVSPLHLAAVMPRTWGPLSAVPAARTLWAVAKAPADGATPLQMQRALLQLLPRDAAAQGLAELFLDPKPETRAPAPASTPEESPAAPRAELTAATTAPQDPGVQSAEAAKAVAAPCPSKSGRGLPTALAIAPLLATALLAVLVAAMLAARATYAASTAAAEHTELAAESAVNGMGKYCSSVACVALLGAAGLLLPAKVPAAAAILSQACPAASCIRAPHSLRSL